MSDLSINRTVNESALTQTVHKLFGLRFVYVRAFNK